MLDARRLPEYSCGILRGQVSLVTRQLPKHTTRIGTAQTVPKRERSRRDGPLPPRIALEVLARADVRVFPHASLVRTYGFEHRLEDPRHCERRGPEVEVLVRVARQIEEHRQLRLDVRVVDGFHRRAGRVAHDHLVVLPLYRHQLAVRAEEQITVAARRRALT